MSGARFAIIDPAAGISGDMLLGALIAAGAPRDWLRGLPARLGIPDVTVDIHQVDRCGLDAVKVDVRLPGGEMEEPADTGGTGHAHDHEHDHHDHDHEHAHDHAHEHHAHQHEGGHTGHRHHGPHRAIGELIALIEAAELSDAVKARAVRAFRLLGAAEGRVHGQPADAVLLHEVGAMDALVDIVGGIEGFERLGIEHVYSRPVALGSGWVRAAHGILPVPAPATAILVEGLEIGSNGPVVGEATTPTGAVLLQVLSEGAPPARWRASQAGAWGAGGRNPVGYANALRLILAEAVREAGEVVLLATDIDDLSPEYLEPLREALFDAGALDVQLWATQMKKGRTGFRLEVTVEPADAAQVTEALFRHSTTAGIRRTTAERITLARRDVMVELNGSKPVRVKVLEGPGGARAKPEYEDVATLARLSGRPAHEVARDLQTVALQLAGAAPAVRPETPNQES
jgi:pyridinium-3,5-bisthiocarboxylic acid mononucleotide nickel chelatase